MSNWNTIAASDVLAEFTPAEQARIEAVQGASTNLAAILSETITELRGIVLSLGLAVGTAGTVPNSFRPQVVHLSRWRWLISLNTAGIALQTKQREDAAKSAEEVFKMLRKGDATVEPVTDETAPQANWNSENKILMRCHPVTRPSNETESQYANANQVYP